MEEKNAPERKRTGDIFVLLRKSGVCGVLILSFCQKAASVAFYQSLKFLKRIL